MAEPLSALLVLCAVGLVAIYDRRTGRVPNLVTLPLLALGLWQHFPGTVERWLVTLLFFAAWRAGIMGGGDLKLWTALVWLTPPSGTSLLPFAVGAVFIVTAGAQLAIRRWRGVRVSTATPAAWRAIPYALWLVGLTWH